MRVTRNASVLAGLALVACSHAEPFSTDPERSDTPAVPGDPAILTRNPLQDLYPAWSADGSSLRYTFESSPVENRDRCLGLLPATGGTRLDQLCNTSAGHLDSTEAYGPSAESPGGRLAYRYAQSLPGALTPAAEEFRVTTAGTIREHDVVFTFPTNVGGLTVGGVGAIRWLSETRLVYQALRIQYAAPAPGAARDTLVDGLAVILLDLNGSAPALIPGTEGATSVALGDAPETILFTLAGDSRVYHHDIAAGATSVLHDFGALGIARDVDRRGDLLVAVVGGAVSFFLDPVLGLRQPDLGGLLQAVDLSTGAATQLAAASPFLYRRPALGPTNHLAVEGYAVTSSGGGTTIEPLADLLLVGTGTP